MPRGSRVLLDNFCYHVVSRGNQKQRIFHDNEDYQKYLQTDTWRRLRQEALEHYGNSCVLCGASKNLNVYHRRYPKELGGESVKDLTVLCKMSTG